MLLLLEECFQEGSALLGLLYDRSAWTLVSTPNVLELIGICQQLWLCWPYTLLGQGPELFFIRTGERLGSVSGYWWLFPNPSAVWRSLTLLWGLYLLSCGWAAAVLCHCYWAGASANALTELRGLWLIRVESDLRFWLSSLWACNPKSKKTPKLNQLQQLETKEV